MASLNRTQSVESTEKPVEIDRPNDPTVRVSLGGVIRSEWIKLWSVRSFYIGLVAAFVVAVGFGVLFSAFAGSQPEDGGGPGPGGPGGGGADPVSLSLAGFNLAVLIVGVLGVLLVTSEYSSGLIRSTISAVPRRIPVLASKAIDLATYLAFTPRADQRIRMRWTPVNCNQERWDSER